MSKSSQLTRDKHRLATLDRRRQEENPEDRRKTLSIPRLKKGNHVGRETA